MKLVLASSSRRRADLLSQIGLEFSIRAHDVDETRRPDEPAPGYVERLAREKALTVAEPGCVAIGADTAVVHQGRVLGKPAHPQEARSMLSRLRGDIHEVFTGLAVVNGEEVRSVVDVTEVRMLPITDAEMDDYVDRGEPMGKAGSYALQGEGAVFVESINGNPYTVIGLPIHLLPRLLQQVGAGLEHFTRSTL